MRILLILIFLLPHFNSFSKEKLTLKGKDVEIWNQLVSKSIKGNKKAYQQILLYPGSVILKGIDAYTYRRYLIDILRKNPSFALNEGYRFLNKRADCLLTWLLFYNNEELINKEKMNIYLKRAELSKTVKESYEVQVKKFFSDDKFLFNTSGCKNNRFSL